MTVTARRDPTRFLYLERQFCSLCRAADRPGVRVVNLAIAAPDRPGFKQRRYWAAMRHLRASHPAQYAEVRRPA